MAKTTINLEDDVYKKLIKEAVEKYGTTRTLSKLINEKLRNAEGIEINRKTEDKEIKRRLDIVRRSAGSWKIKETGSEYVRKLRNESEKRLKRMGL